MPESEALDPGKMRAFVGIECDVPHLMSSTVETYRGAYVCWGMPGQVHHRMVINTGSPTHDFASAFMRACDFTSNVVISGTADFFASRSGGKFELHGTRMFRPHNGSVIHAA